VAVFFSRADVERAVSPEEAYEAVREGFVAHARGEWTMQPKLYVTNYPAGDFRAMPALGGGHALLKWVTSFPGNRALGLPTVTGLVVLSDAATGTVEAVLDAGAVTALRTGAAAVLAAATLGRGGSIAVVGCGVNGTAAARTFATLGLDLSVWDVDGERAAAVARELGAEVAGSREEALASDVVVTVTPGAEILYPEGSLQPGQHVSLMGADGPGKAEIAVEELARARVFCDDWEQAGTKGTPIVRLFVDDWEQASHGGETAAAAGAGLISREDVTQLGDVLAGLAPGRRHEDDITLFDSTGLAIQDLAIAKVALARADELDLPTLAL
jgi:ornithine cyclodeaminase/alanine dehydrogenase-like protein (mu-crystallin family)